MKNRKWLVTIVAIVFGIVLVGCQTTANQGDIVKKAIVINNKALNKTAEVVIIPKGTTVTIHLTDDSAWNSFVPDSEEDFWKGAFIKDRSVTLSPFVMSAYEVTQELYEAVIGKNPSYFKSNPANDEKQTLRPVEKVTWYDCIAFCNELTKKTMSESDCVYTITNLETNNGHIVDASVTIDLTKIGYRLPTEAEWEFAVRGGDTTKEDWKYAYSGSQTEIDSSKFTKVLYKDSKLDKYGWDNSNSERKTHEVGKKLPNRLGLYDMSGNVYEWCYDLCFDWHGSISTDAVTNPVGYSFGSCRVLRGGNWDLYSKYCSVSCRGNHHPNSGVSTIGFRLARSLVD